MAQKIVVQDGIITYSTSDPTEAVDFTIAGQANVTKQLNVGDDLLANGLITTQNGVDLEITTSLTGDLKLAPGGNLLLNNVAWPNGTVTPTPGIFIGASSSNILQYYQFIIATALSDNLTQNDLNIAYPGTQIGQYVIGPTVMYFYAGGGTWRKFISENSGPSLTSITTVSYNSPPTISAFDLPPNATILNIQVVVDQTFTGSPAMAIGISGDSTKYADNTEIDLLAVERSSFIIYPGQIPPVLIEPVEIYYAANSATSGSARVIISYYLGA